MYLQMNGTITTLILAQRKRRAVDQVRRSMMRNQTMTPTHDRLQRKVTRLFFFFGMSSKVFNVKYHFGLCPFLGSNNNNNSSERSLYINTDTYRKPDKKRSSSSQESENLNSNTFTKSPKPKRVESLIKRFDMSFWRRHKGESKEKSPSPSGSDTIKRSKNIFNLMTSGKKTTRDVGIECKMDEDRDYYGGMGTRKSSILSLISEKKYRPTKIATKRYENGSNQQLTGIIKTPERRYPYEKKSTILVSAPIRVEIGIRNSHKYMSETDANKKRPIGIASPLPQARNRSALKNGMIKNNDSKKAEAPRSYASMRAQETSNFTRDGSDKISFREYREKLKQKNDNRRVTDNSEDELRKSYQQSFFIPAWIKWSWWRPYVNRNSYAPVVDW